MPGISDGSLDLLSTIFDEKATVGDLLKLVLFLAFLIFAAFALLRPVLKRLCEVGFMRPTIESICDQEFNRPDKIDEQKIFGLTTKQEYFDHLLLSWPETMLTLSQHMIGGMFAIPSVIGWEKCTESVAASLACLGIMTEMGWEIQQLVEMAFWRVFKGELGKAMYPNAVVVVLCIHHSLTCFMGLPMIHAYRRLPELHRMCFDLQFLSGLCAFGGEYCRTLDVSKKNELVRFWLVSFLMLLLALWTRFFNWFFLSYNILALFYTERNWAYLAVGGCAILLFSLLNVFGITIPIVQRFFKFTKKLMEYDGLPDDADDGTRKSAVHDLRAAAAELTNTETRFDETFMAFLFKERNVERRHTMDFASLSRSAALVAATGSSSRNVRLQRQSMIAWRHLPSKQQQRAAVQAKAETGKMD